MVKNKTDEAYKKDGRYVPNHSALQSFWHNGVKWVIPIDFVLGNKATVCGEWVELGQQWTEDMISNEFPGAIVDQLSVTEATSARDDLHKRQGIGFVDYTDAIYRDNHVANRIIFPNGERYIVDYWESSYSGKPEVIPEREWIAKWGGKLAGDMVVNQPEGHMSNLKVAIESYKQTHGNTLEFEHQAILEYQRSHPGDPSVEVVIRSWRERPW